MLNNVLLTAKIGLLKAKVFLSQSVEELLNAEPGENNPTHKVNDMVQDYGAGGMSIMRSVFVYAAGISILIVAVLMVLYGRNRSKTSEIKDGLGWQIFGLILGFGAVGFVVFMQTIGQNLFTP